MCRGDSEGSAGQVLTVPISLPSSLRAPQPPLLQELLMERWHRDLRLPLVPYLVQQHLPLPGCTTGVLWGHWHSPLQPQGTQKRPFWFSVHGGVCRKGRSNPRSTRCHILHLLPNFARPGGVIHEFWEHRVPAQCRVSCPALLSSDSAGSGFHGHLWQRHLPVGHILLSCLPAHAARWDEVTAKLLPEISTNTFGKHNGLCKSLLLGPSSRSLL